MPLNSQLVSIHDVMPATLDAVRRTVDGLQAAGVRRVTLLVVPGLAWHTAQLAQLRAWSGQGIDLAGHGWLHDCARFGGWYHRLHGWLLSRRVAEHLALDAGQICALIGRCHAWFAAHDLPAPSLYVPPAWAMGPLPPARLRELPFRYYERLDGVIDGASGRVHRLPLLGYQADRYWRVPLLRASNALNRCYGRLRGAPLRIAIHPEDPDLPLFAALHADLRRSAARESYDEVMRRLQAAASTGR